MILPPDLAAPPPLTQCPPDGVGLLHIAVASAVRLNPNDAADGAYYVSVAVEGQERRTNTVPTSSPVFSQAFTLYAPHYRSNLVFTVPYLR